MGLDIQVDTVSFRAGSYSGFHDFRKWLARQALGIDLTSMDGFGGTTPWASLTLPAEMKGLPILLSHSDCDGDITPSQAKELLVALEAYKDGAGVLRVPNQVEYYWGNIDEWIEACRISIAKRKRIIFS